MGCLKNIMRDYVLISSILLLILITAAYPYLVNQYISFISWNTIFILAALFLITTAIKDSRYLDILSAKVVENVKTERNLSLLLVILAFTLSMAITNDVTLLILVPFTLSLQKYVAKDIRKMIIFETIAVNAGSALTPIGNPQNIYLWKIWNIGFYEFMLALLPVWILMLIMLVIFVFLVFPSKEIEKMTVEREMKCDKFLATISVIMLITLIIAMDAGWEIYVIPAVFCVYAIYGRKVYLHVDWALLLVFLIFFVDFNALGHIPFIRNFLASRSLNGLNAIFYGSVFSQFMSNVPAAVLLANFTVDYRALAYGVSIGGNGTIIASLANLISLRFVKDRKWILEFHKYSIIYFTITFLLTYIFWEFFCA